MADVVAIVEQDADLAGALSDVLRDEGYSVDVLQTGNEALAHLRRSPPPCVLVVGIALPDMSGEALCRMLAADEQLRHIPVLLFTSETVGRRSCLALHAAGQIPKPIDLDRLIYVLNQVCTKSR